MSDSPFAGIAPPGGVDYGSFSFSVKQFVLLSLAESVSHAVPSGRPTQPVLGCFRFTVKDGLLEAVATTPDQSAFAETSAVVCASQDPQLLYLDAKRLLSILREAPPGDVEVTVKKNQATIAAGKSVSWDVKLPDPGAYPKLPVVYTVEFKDYDRQQLLAGLRAVRHAICKDAGQPSLTQVAIAADASGAMVVTASDRTRLARAPLAGFPLPVTIPAVALDDLQRQLSGHPAETVGVGETGAALVFRVGNVTLSVNKRTQPFPDMDKQLLAPALKENTCQLTVDRAELSRAVKRVAINADDKTSAIGLRLAAESVTVEAKDKAGNSAQETVLASWAGTERVVVVNHGHLTEMLTASPAQSCTFMLGPDVGKRLSPLLLTGDGSAQVLTRMPAALLGY